MIAGITGQTPRDDDTILNVEKGCLFLLTAGKDASLMKRMKELEDENRRLKKMYAEER